MVIRTASRIGKIISAGIDAINGPVESKVEDLKRRVEIAVGHAMKKALIARFFEG